LPASPAELLVALPVALSAALLFVLLAVRSTC
jgi:hypothetical protein